jgi:hypothetical protein
MGVSKKIKVHHGFTANAYKTWAYTEILCFYNPMKCDILKDMLGRLILVMSFI